MPCCDRPLVVIGAYDCHIVVREDLFSIMRALVLTSPIRDSVDRSAVGTLQSPRSVQARSSRIWISQKETNCPSCSKQLRNEYPPRILHCASSLCF
jgi:hypothetical protein